MKIKFEEGDSVNIPENCVAKIMDDVVIFEVKEPKFKKGDFVISENKYGRSMAILKGPKERFSFCEYFGVNRTGDLTYFNGRPFGLLEDYRLMTDPEKQLLLDKLHESGKDWDDEKCEIVDLKYIPEIGDCVKVLYADGCCMFECTVKDSTFVDNRIYVDVTRKKGHDQ